MSHSVWRCRRRLGLERQHSRVRDGQVDRSEAGRAQSIDREGQNAEGRSQEIARQRGRPRSQSESAFAQVAGQCEAEDATRSFVR